MKASLIFFLAFFGTINLIAQKRDLDFYLDQAKTNSPLINQNQNQGEMINLDLEQIRRMLSKSEINIESNVLFAPIISHDHQSNHFEWASGGADDYNGYDLASTDGGQYQAFVSVQQPLFTHSMYRSYLNKSTVSRQINKNDLALTIHEIRYLVTHQYLICLKSKKLAENRKSLLDRLDEQINTMRKLVENAIYNQTDLILLQIEYRNYLIEYKALQADYENNLYDLYQLSGIRDTTRQDIPEVNIQINRDTFLQSKFVNAYELDSLNATADQSIYLLKYKPRLSLFANAGLNAVYLPKFNRLGFSTGFNLTWNIYDGNQGKIQKEKTAIEQQTIVFNKNFFITKNTINKNKILNQIELIGQRMTLYEQQINQYDQLYEVYREEMPMNMVSVMDFKILLNDMSSAQKEYLTLEMEKQILINAYNYWNY